MKHILQIFKFEYLSCVKAKSFIISTAIFMVLILGMTFIPAIIASVQSSKETKDGEKAKPVIAIIDKAYGSDAVKTTFGKYYSDSDILVVDEDIEAVKDKVDGSEYNFAVVLDTPSSYTYITKNNSMISNNAQTINSAVTEIFRITSLQKLGVSADDTDKVLNTQLTSRTITTGVDQTKNYISTYIIILMLYMAIIMYGQMVSQSVVSEKNTRAMEMLITCAKPSHLMFGKVFGSGLAGLTQLVLIIATAIVSVNTIGSNSIPDAILEYLHLPISTALYALLFFTLGYFIYSFLLAAFASLASRSEDLNTLISPVMIIYIAAFMLIIISINSDAANSPIMVVCSYIPFTAPIAMFTRIALADVSIIEIVISIVVQIISVYLLGMLSAAIYRVGVLMYGKPPKPAEIIRLLKAQRSTNKKSSAGTE